MTTHNVNTKPLIEVSDLETCFFTDEGTVNAVSNISFKINENEIYGIVGESGSGKSVTAQSILDIIESPGKITNGEIWYRNPDLANILANEYPDSVDGERINLLELPSKMRQVIRGKYFGIIFQDPKESFNKSYTVGDQIAEAVEIQNRIDKNIDNVNEINYSLIDYFKDTFSLGDGFISEQSRKRAIELLELVGMPDPIQRAEEYPYQFSGGMLQRAMIAQALASDPEFLIADEPTTALDVTIQSQIIKILSDISGKKDMSVLIITHNLGVIARMCDRVGVMYAGELVEQGPVYDIFNNPHHPYTIGLLNSAPDTDQGSERLDPIPGSVPNLIDREMPEGCYFRERCPEAMDKCTQDPSNYHIDEGHISKCFLAEEQSIDHNSEKSKVVSEDN